MFKAVDRASSTQRRKLAWCAQGVLAELKYRIGKRKRTMG